MITRRAGISGLLARNFGLVIVVVGFVCRTSAEVIVDGGNVAVTIPVSAGGVGVFETGGNASTGTVLGGTVTTITSLYGLPGAGVISAGGNAGTAFLTVHGGDYGGILADGTLGTGLLALTKKTEATLTLSGPNTYTGGTRIEAGELVVANNHAMGTGSVLFLGGTLSGDAINFANHFEIGSAAGLTSIPVQLGRAATAPVSTLLIMNGPVVFRQTAEITVPGYANVIMAGTVSGKGFVKAGEGNLYLQNFATHGARNTHGEETTLRAGILGINDKADLGNSRVRFEGGTLDLGDVSHSRQVNKDVIAGHDIASAIGPVEAGQTAKIIAGVDAPHKTEFATGLSGLGGLEVVSGTLQVAANNSYAGRTVVNEGATLVLPAASSISNSSEVIIKGTVDGSSGGFAFRPGQAVEIRNGDNHLGAMKLKDGTADWTKANLAVDIARRMGAFGPGIAQVGVPVNGTSSAVMGVTLKVITPEFYTVDVEQVESVTPVEPKDYFTAYDDAGTEITDRSRVGAVTGSIVSARPIYAVNAVNGLRWKRQSYSRFGTGSNGTSFGKYLDQQISANSHQPLPRFLRETVDQLRESVEIERVLREMSARPFADMPRLGVQRSIAVLGGVEDRVASLAASDGAPVPSSKFGYKQEAAPVFAASTGATPAPNSAAQSDRQWTAWSGVYGRGGTDKADESQGTSRVDTSESGARLGIERRLGTLTLGVTGAEGWGRYTFETPSALISTDFWHLGLYALAPVGNGWLDASFLHTSGRNRSSRAPQLSAFTGTGDAVYLGKFDSGGDAVSVGFAYNLCSPDWVIQASPVVRLSYLSYHQAAFSESDAGLGAYRVGKVNTETFVSKLGQRMSIKKELTAHVGLESDLGIYWQHDWGNRGHGVNVSLASGLGGTSYQAVGGRGTDDLVTVSYGVQFTVNRRYFIRGSATAELCGGRETVAGAVTFGIVF